MSIKGWRKISDVKYESINFPGNFVFATKKYLRLPNYEGWGVLHITPSGKYVVFPSNADWHRKNFRMASHILSTKKDAIEFMKGWMRKHPYDKYKAR